MHKFICSVLVSFTLACLPSNAVAVENVKFKPAQMVPAPEQSVLLAVDTFENKAVAVGERGIIVLSEDGGNSWVQLASPVDITLTNVELLNRDDIWVVGHAGIVLNSRDGGVSWSVKLDGVSAAQAIYQQSKVNIKENSESVGRMLLRSAELLVQDGPDKPFLDLKFFDPVNGVIVGAYGMALVTSDGGESWRSLFASIPNPMGKHYYGIAKLSEGYVIAGEQGSVYIADDKLKKFVSVSPPYDGSFFGVEAIGDNILIYGLKGNAFYSESRGKSWKKVANNSDVSISSSTSDGTNIWVTNQAGDVYLFDRAGMKFVRTSISGEFPFTAIALRGANELILSGMRGVYTAEIKTQ